MRTFNVNFYITAATVIPVFYLTLILQVRTYEKAMARWKPAERGSPSTFWLQAHVIIPLITAMVGAVVVLSGLYAEFLSIQALYEAESSPTAQGLVLVSFAALLAMTVIVPFYAFWVSYIGRLARDYRASKSAEGSQKD